MKLLTVPTRPFPRSTLAHDLGGRLPACTGLPPITSLQTTVPKLGQVRVRRIIHRGAPRPTAKVPSIKLGRTVHCESLLEVDAALILDACPQVTRFAEQPVILHYLDGHEWRTHIPDFAAETTGRVHQFVEVKFKRDIDLDVIRRTDLLTLLLKPYGIAYRLLTENDLRVGCRLENASRLLLRGRERGSDAWAFGIFEAIRSQGFLSLGDFGWHHVGRPETAWIAREIIEGRVQADLSRLIDHHTKVVVPQFNFEEGSLWPSAVSR